MSIDMSQFYQVFFDEASEHLANMEALLLNLDVAHPALEDLNAIFRAAHSIKGGSGTFGFTDMTAVTHVLETLLDRLRKQELGLRAEMVDAFLAAGDVLRAQLHHHQGGPAADAAEIEAVCATLNRLAAGDAAAAPAAPAAPPAQARTLTLDCLLPAAVADNPAAVDHLLAALGEFAALELRQRPDGAHPHLHAVLTTSLGDEELRDALGFYLAADEIGLSAADAADTPAEDAGYGFFTDTPTAPAEDPGYGLFTDTPTAPAEDPGYGFFTDTPAAAAATDDPGYGFFTDAPAAPARPAAAVLPPPGRRLTDQPALETARSGRRDGDRTVSASSADTSIRVAVEKVDQLINLVGELVITQAMLAEAASALEPVAAERLLAGIDLLARNTRDLQEAVMSIRMLPMSMVFSRFPRVVRDLAGKLGKQVEMKTIGEGTELDKGLIEKIADPLTHLVRNSLDHGIEPPEQRIAAGKPPKGTLTLKASHQGGNVVIEVMDDGGGLNRDRILAKAEEKGLPGVHAGMSDFEVWQLIFAPGFSTAEQVTDVSGRGVGMDVVKRNIEGLGGRVELESAPGHGTRTIIRLPLTLAILDGMSVAVGGETYIIPLTAIVESLQPRAEDVRTLAGDSRMMHVRGEYLPFIALAEVFGLGGVVQDVTRGIVMVIESEEGKAALFVDGLLGQHQVVIKSLEANYRKVPGVSGATIMGDGSVAMILDLAALTRMGLEQRHRSHPHQPQGRVAA